MIAGLGLIALLFVLIMINVPVYVSLGVAGTTGLAIIAMGPGFGDPFIAIPPIAIFRDRFFPVARDSTVHSGRRNHEPVGYHRQVGAVFCHADR